MITCTWTSMYDKNKGRINLPSASIEKWNIRVPLLKPAAMLFNAICAIQISNVVISLIVIGQWRLLKLMRGEVILKYFSSFLK